MQWPGPEVVLTMWRTKQWQDSPGTVCGGRCVGEVHRGRCVGVCTCALCGQLGYHFPTPQQHHAYIYRPPIWEGSSTYPTHPPTHPHTHTHPPTHTHLQGSKRVCLLFSTVNLFCKYRPLGLFVQFTDTSFIKLNEKGRGIKLVLQCRDNGKISS